MIRTMVYASEKQHCWNVIKVIQLLQQEVMHTLHLYFTHWHVNLTLLHIVGLPVAQMVEHGASNAKIMGLIPRESKNWSNVKL